MLAYQTLRTGSVGLGGSTSALLGRSLTRLSASIDSSLMQVRLESGPRAPERVSVRELLEEVEVGATLEAADGGEIRIPDMPGQGCIFTIDLPRLTVAP
jgi:hypothetical protein